MKPLRSISLALLLLGTALASADGPKEGTYKFARATGGQTLSLAKSANGNFAVTGNLLENKEASIAGTLFGPGAGKNAWKLKAVARVPDKGKFVLQDVLGYWDPKKNTLVLVKSGRPQLALRFIPKIAPPIVTSPSKCCCPYLYVLESGRSVWSAKGQILIGRIGAADMIEESIDLESPISMIAIREEEDEVTHITACFLEIIDASGRSTILQARRRFVNELILRKGAERVFHFDVPIGQRNLRARLHITGFYEPLGDKAAR